MKLEAGTTVTVDLDGKEHRFLLVRTNGNGKEKLSLKAPLVKILGGMGVGDTLTWKVSVVGGEKMKVKLVKVEEAA